MSWTASQSLWQEWSRKVRLCLQSLDSQFVLCSIFQHLRVLHAIDIVFFEFYFQRKAQRQKYELLHVASFIPTYSSSFLKSGRPKASFHPPVQMNVSYPRHHFNLTAVVVGLIGCCVSGNTSNAKAQQAVRLKPVHRHLTPVMKVEREVNRLQQRSQQQA